jgi:hypothetical protein
MDVNRPTPIQRELFNELADLEPQMVEKDREDNYPR